MAVIDIRLKRIEFHAPTSINYHSVGDGYELPSGRAATTVTFDVLEDGGYSLQMTQVLRGHFETLDDLLKAAYFQLRSRLNGLGEGAEMIAEPPKAQPAA